MRQAFSSGITPPADSSGEALAAVTAGPDGNVWFAESRGCLDRPAGVPPRTADCWIATTVRKSPARTGRPALHGAAFVALQ